MKSTKSKAAARRAGFISGGIDKFAADVWYFQREQGLTCPSQCALMNVDPDSGAATCYAEPGPKRYRAKMMFLAAARRRAMGITFPDITTLPDNSRVRLQPAGDMGRIDDGDTLDAEYVDGLHDSAAQRPDVDIWTYFHGWKAAEWRDGTATLRALPNVNVLASCDTDADVELAIGYGLQVSIHRPDVDKSTAYTVRNGRRFLNCPEQRGRSKCGECMACHKVPRGVDGIMFSEH